MLRGQRKQHTAAEADWPLLLFSIGGGRLAARADEIGGVRPWVDAVPIPSTTPFINALVRYEEEVLPVYDLAARLHRDIEGASPFCMIAKRNDGPMAVRIDARIPQLTSVSASSIEREANTEAGIVGYCHIEGQRIPICSFAH